MMVRVVAKNFAVALVVNTLAVFGFCAWVFNSVVATGVRPEAWFP